MKTMAHGFTRIFTDKELSDKGKHKSILPTERHGSTRKKTIAHGSSKDYQG